MFNSIQKYFFETNRWTNEVLNKILNKTKPFSLSATTALEQWLSWVPKTDHPLTITIISRSSCPTGHHWRLRRIKIAAVSSKSQKLQQQHQFSTRQRIFAPPIRQKLTHTTHTRRHTLIHKHTIEEDMWTQFSRANFALPKGNKQTKQINQVRCVCGRQLIYPNLGYTLPGETKLAASWVCERCGKITSWLSRIFITSNGH